MKIQGSDSGALPQVSATRGAEAASRSKEAGPEAAAPHAGLREGGSLRLSERVGQVDKVRELAHAEPEIRADVVAQARADLAAGRLVADPADLAARIARDIF